MDIENRLNLPKPLKLPCKIAPYFCKQLSEVQDTLRSELMAEMSVEGAQKQKLGEQIKAEMKQ
jgi:hypothetical protein